MKALKFTFIFLLLALTGPAQSFTLGAGMASGDTLIIDRLFVESNDEPVSRQNITLQNVIHTGGIVYPDGSITNSLNIDESLTSIGANDIWIEFDRKYAFGTLPRCHATAINTHAVAKVDASFNRVRVSFKDLDGNVVFPAFSFTCN